MKQLRGTVLSEVITETEWRHLADQPSRTSHAGKRNLAILHALYFAALGFFEVCELSPWDVNGTARGIYVPASGMTRRRFVTVPSEAWKVFEAWEEVRPPSPYFFATLSGNRLREQYVRGFLRRYGDRSGVTKPTRAVAAPCEPRGPERSYASTLLARGLPEVSLARGLTGTPPLLPPRGSPPMRG
jgi:site-specific recombinase XerD